jgi:hypothetical protein
MSNHRVRNLIPPIYGLLIVVAFLISPTAGLIVAVVGGMLCGLLWSTMSGGPGGRERPGRAARRAGRR